MQISVQLLEVLYNFFFVGSALVRANRAVSAATSPPPELPRAWTRVSRPSYGFRVRASPKGSTSIRRPCVSVSRTRQQRDSIEPARKRGIRRPGRIALVPMALRSNSRFDARSYANRRVEQPVARQSRIHHDEKRIGEIDRCLSPLRPKPDECSWIVLRQKSPLQV